ncbi:allatostatin-A receptor-like [Ptychodera flava]|uniref:allatostatin-A receptor-like n=1 Tax=Ptychodera flava TaxID=63121 RepID=UPI00396A062C
MSIENTTTAADNTTFETAYTHASLTFTSLDLVQLLVGIVGTIGNAAVVATVASVTFLRTIPNFFIAGLAITDLLASLCIVAKVFYSQRPIPAMFDPDVYCKLVISNIFFWLTATASVFILVGVTIERYVAIVYPFLYQAKFTQTKAIILIITAWVLSFLSCSFIPVVTKFHDGYCFEIWPSETYMLFTGFAVFFFTYLTPMVFTIFAYVKMFYQLHKTSMPSIDASMMVARRRILRLLSLVVAAFFTCWSPNQLIYLAANCGVNIDFYSWYYEASVLLSLANSCVNPFIYALRSRQFRDGFRLALFRCPNAVGNESTAVAAT